MIEESILDAKKKKTSEKITKVVCKDGSYTYYNHEVGQAYHSPIGAALESKEKFVAPSSIKERAKSGTISILDVCFGFGYNSAAAIDAIWKENPKCHIKIIGLEIDKYILNESLQLPFPFEHEEIFQKLSKNFDEEQDAFIFEDDKINIRLLIGDALERVCEVKEKVDLVYFDPFSPNKAPELWTESFMRDIYDKCTNGATLLTYSCARGVRDNLKRAGFIVEDGPIVGRRGPATIGRVTKSS